MTYEELEKVINSTISDNSIKDKAKSIVSKVKELENISSYYEIHFLPIYDADGEQVNKANDIIPIYGDSVAYSDTQISICRDNKVVFTCSPSLVYYVCKKWFGGFRHMTYSIKLTNGEEKVVENVTDIQLDKDGMCRVAVENADSAYLIFPKNRIELIELIDF